MKRNKIIFDFCREAKSTLDKVALGQLPKEFMLGYHILKERGEDVSYIDDRWTNGLAPLRKKLYGKLEIPSFKMISAWWNSDTIVIATRFSFSLALTGKLMGKRVIFYDSMQSVPQSVHRRLMVSSALRLSNKLIGFSSSQATLWQNEFPFARHKITAIPYGIDEQFYSSTDNTSNPLNDAIHSEDQSPSDNKTSATNNENYIIAVGRDPNRDFDTLLAATTQLNWSLKLVTMPYLIPKNVSENPNVEILNDLSFSELFSLYKNAKAAVIPLKENTTHMSGIRAIFEAVMLEVPVVTANSIGMTELFENKREVLYYAPGDVSSLTEALLSINDSAENMTQQAKQKVLKHHNVNLMAEGLLKELN